MGQETSQIKSEIEATRNRMSDTVDAIAYKADVPARVRDDVNGRIESVKETVGNVLAGSKKKAGDSVAAVGERASDVSNAAANALDESRSRISDAAGSTRQAVSMAVENPLGLALGALALGLLGGLLVPTSDLERRRIGPLHDEIAERAQVAVDEVVQAGKSVLSETIAAATESAQQHGKEVAQHVASASGPAG